MVAIRPFRAWRYNPEVVGDLGQVLAPPYDIIGPEAQERLYQASPYNVVRLILGKTYPTDTGAENRYSRAQRDFAAWRTQRVLQPDPVPALYLVEQTFRDGGADRSRLGFIALLELDGALEGRVFRHEATLAAPKEDRTRLLAALPANLEPIFCVYPDEGGRLQERLRRLTAAAPAMQAALPEETVRVWALTDPQLLEEAARRLASVSVLIADGHHRFEVAHAYRDRYGALMTYFVSMADPALAVRPIHRVVQPEGRDAPHALREVCRLEPAADLAACLRWVEGAGEGGRFGYYDGQALHQAAVIPERLARWRYSPSVPPPVAGLDVSLLHGLILPHLASDGRPQRFAYTADAAEALRAVDRGEGRCAWLLRGIPLAQVYALAAQGFALPPKSTYFHPKVPSGLTIHAWQDTINPPMPIPARVTE